ncbi:hypothetical protein C0991_008184 [Blastosporella zonata]|nr:hypothetical protein C0991_008184 [Blastosporella zonata]
MPAYGLTPAPPVMEETSTLIRRDSWSKLSRAHHVSEHTPSLPPSLVAMDQKPVGSIYTISPKTTSVNFPWPQEVTGLERIALSAKGDLQRVLSAFFDRPITIATVYSNTFYHPTIEEPTTPLTLPNPAALSAASIESPITQMRQVHLQCSSKNVCTATSTVRITSPTAAHLFLVEKYAIGQMFVRMGKVPDFELVSVGLGPVTGDEFTSPGSSYPSEKPHTVEEQQLWRKYRLFVEGFECDILEVFPTRDMFLGGLQWLEDPHGYPRRLDTPLVPVVARHPQTGLVLFLSLGFLLMLTYELSAFITGQSFFCPS